MPITVDGVLEDVLKFLGFSIMLSDTMSCLWYKQVIQSFNGLQYKYLLLRL